jgi:hypothetical protein
MPKELINDLEPCHTERGHPCARPVLMLAVRTFKGGVAKYLPMRFLLDTGASTTAIPLVFARTYCIPFESDAEPDRCFRLAAAMDGYWGSIHILLLEEHLSRKTE